MSRNGVSDFAVLSGKFGVELSQSTLRAEKRVEGRMMSDTKPVKHTAVSFGFNVEITNSFCGYVRFFHLDITLRTVVFTHCVQINLCSRLVKKSGHSVIIGDITAERIVSELTLCMCFMTESRAILRTVQDVGRKSRMMDSPE